MGFFAKIKQTLGIGTVKVTATAPPSFSTDDASISGTVGLLAKSDQEVLHVEVRLEELWTTGRGEDKKEKTFILGTLKLPGFTMKAGESKTLDYTLPFTYGKSDNERMAEQGGVMGGIGKLAKFAGGEQSTFQLVATCDVKGTSLDPNDIVAIKKR